MLQFSGDKMFRRNHMADQNDKQPKSDNRKSIGMGLGVALGVALGAAMHNIGLGLAIGIIIGGISIAAGRRRTEKDK
jgi:hypothetical protein